jgi:tetratricopeptide (TPR) repeat protein
MHARAFALTLLLAATAYAGDTNSWVGKAVIVIGYNVPIVNGKTDGSGNLVPSATLSRLQYHVEDQDGEYIKVRENGTPGWFPKAQAVLLDDAADYFTKAIAASPQSVDLYNKRAEVYLTTGKYDLAIGDYNDALRLMPGERALLNNRGRAYTAKKDYDSAINDFDAALLADPKYTFAYCNRATCYTAKKDYARAVKDYDEALRLLPDLPNANNDLAWLRATCPDAKFRDGKIAVEKATKACELTNWRDGVILDTLAAACAEAGKFDDAVKWQKKAIEDKRVDKLIGKEMRARVKLYEQKKPYRQSDKPPKPEAPSNPNPTVG